MGRKRKITNTSKQNPYVHLPKLENKGPVFDAKAVLLIACLNYNIREAVLEAIPKYHKGLGDIPKSAAMAAIKSLKLDHFLYEEDKKDD